MGWVGRYCGSPLRMYRLVVTTGGSAPDQQIQDWVTARDALMYIPLNCHQSQFYYWMGNEMQAADRNDENFRTAINNISYISKKRSESFVDEGEDVFTGKPEVKWKEGLLRALKEEAIKRKKNKKDEMWDLEEIIRNIREDSFIKAVSILSTLASTTVEQNASKGVLKQTFVSKVAEQHKSEHVRIQIDSRFWRGQASDSVSTGSMHSTGGSFVKSNSTIKRNLQKILAKQINQQYHPIRTLKDSFIMMLQMKYRTHLDERPPTSKKQRQRMLQDIHDDIDFYCCFVAEGCRIYKSWIEQQAGVKDTKYNEFAKRIVLESLFTGISLSEQMFPLIKEICSKQIQKLVEKLPSQIEIEKFKIKQDLAIQGAYMNSLMRLSDFDTIQSPSMCMQKLQIIKTEICYDIDEYHKIFGSEKNYKIDGDNFLSIICFLLCRMKPKLFQIYTQLNLLSVIFGDNTAALFDDASYILTAFLAAFEHLADKQFVDSL